MALPGIASKVDPRKVGGLYYCGYWGRYYTVTAHTTLGEHYSADVWTYKWDDGSSTTHMTGWDKRLDRVISQPTGDDQDTPSGA